MNLKLVAALLLIAALLPRAHWVQATAPRAIS